MSSLHLPSRRWLCGSMALVIHQEVGLKPYSRFGQPWKCRILGQVPSGEFVCLVSDISFLFKRKTKGGRVIFGENDWIKLGFNYEATCSRWKLVKWNGSHALERKWKEYCSPNGSLERFFCFRWWGGLRKEGFMQAWFGCDVLQYFEDLRCLGFYFCHKALYIYIEIIRSCVLHVFVPFKDFSPRVCSMSCLSLFCICFNILLRSDQLLWLRLWRLKWVHLCAPLLSQPCFGNRKLRAWGQFRTQEQLVKLVVSPWPTQSFLIES